MSELLITVLAKGLASVAMSGAVAFAVYKTKSANCLWALAFITMIW